MRTDVGGADVNHGSLVAIEGIDGTGKTTQAGLLVQALEAKGLQVVATREPTGGATASEIRSLAAAGKRAEPARELELFQADRDEHVREVIRPALQGGKIVVTDRYYLSTVAYQGARGLDFAAILTECEARFPIPDLAIILEIEPSMGIERVVKRGAGIVEAFERVDLLQAVDTVFRQINRPYVVRIRGDTHVDQVAAELNEAVRNHLDFMV